MTALLWFQRDLRIQHNSALCWLKQQKHGMIAVYIHSPEEDHPWASGAASNWWLHHSLLQLKKQLASLNIPLLCLSGNTTEQFDQLIDHYSVSTVAWTRRCEPHRQRIETNLQNILTARGIHVHTACDGLIGNYDQLLTRQATPYKVFTPFYQRLRTEAPAAATCAWPTLTAQTDSKTLQTAFAESIVCSVDSLDLLDSHPWHQKLHQYWQPGETAAHRQLHNFINEALTDYPAQRDIPAHPGTSALSAHLHFGEISSRQILQTLLPLLGSSYTKLEDACESYWRQLLWREFARYTLHHFPHSAQQALNANFSNEFWQTDDALLKQWQQGNTGIPIIDAGMQQLWETGWMHNRVRMLVASFLTKNLNIHWLQGAKWFWDTLVDADLANNSMGWQWVAGCGVDAAPYFRIFNPQTQTSKFDPDHQYVRRWQKSTPPPASHD